MELEQVMQALRNAHAAGDTEAARRLAAMAQNLQASEPAPQMPQVSGDALQDMAAAVQGASPTMREPVASGAVVPEWVQGQMPDPDMQEATPLGETVAAALNNGGEALTFGLVGDEAAARFDDMLGRGTYDERLQVYRDQEEQLRENNPALYWTSEIAPAFLAGGAGAARLANSGRGLLSRMVMGAGGGMAAGAAEGFMEGEGQSDRLSQGLIGGAFGGILGGMLPAAGDAARTLYNRIGTGPARQARVAMRQAQLSPTAAAMVSEAVGRDATTAASNFARAGDDAVNAMAGPNTGALLDWAANRPGGAGSGILSEVNDRAAQAGRRFTGVLDDILGEPAGVNRATRELMQETASARGAAYDAAYGQAIDYSTEAARNLEGLLDRVPERAIRTANEMLSADGHRSAQILADIADDGVVTFREMPDVRQLDYITRALQDMGGFNSGVGRDQGRIYGNLTREIRNTLDELVPEYGQARALGADTIANREAIQFGRDLLTRRTTMDVAEDSLEQMTDAERTFAAQGVRSHIDEIMANAQRALTDTNMDAREAIRPLREVTSRAGQTKLTALLGEEAGGRLQSEAERALASLEMRAATAMNSRTAMRQTLEGIVADRMPRTASEALDDGDGILAAVRAGVRPIMQSDAPLREQNMDALVEELGSYLMRPVGQTSLPAQGIGQLPSIMRAANDRGQLYRQGTQGILGGLGMGAIAGLN